MWGGTQGHGESGANKIGKTLSSKCFIFTWVLWLGGRWWVGPRKREEKANKYLLTLFCARLHGRHYLEAQACSPVSVIFETQKTLKTKGFFFFLLHTNLFFGFLFLANFAANSSVCKTRQRLHTLSFFTPCLIPEIIMCWILRYHIRLFW